MLQKYICIDFFVQTKFIIFVYKNFCKNNMPQGMPFFYFNLGSVHIKSELQIKAREIVEIKMESSLL